MVAVDKIFTDFNVAVADFGIGGVIIAFVFKLRHGIVGEKRHGFVLLHEFSFHIRFVSFGEILFQNPIHPFLFCFALFIFCKAARIICFN